ncbi:MAG: malate dehydrogenase, partial [Arcobacteraceae bacterium]|nr:malate dehydrogenase [Arcobacteraceae bacterium]
SGEDKLTFSKTYILPKPFDKRLLVNVSLAVAKAAVESGVSRVKVFDEVEYRGRLGCRL